VSAAEKIIEELKKLPEPIAEEVLDFVRFLANREESKGDSALKAGQAATMRRLWDNPEDEIWNDV
jgi:mRNA-degrading endonuclease RelE of RelBE toxin-antitoxin system